MDYYQLQYELDEQKRDRNQAETDQERIVKLQYKPNWHQSVQTAFNRDND